MDSTGTNFACIVSVYQFFKIGQMRSDSEVARNHDKGFALADQCADPMWAAEQN